MHTGSCFVHLCSNNTWRIKVEIKGEIQTEPQVRFCVHSPRQLKDAMAKDILSVRTHEDVQMFPPSTPQKLK
jgi:hypothetical protein